ncbi:LCP family protein [Neobacillus kokaensis]|uniref:LytR family transcriptional regulator n=1 Tax=Neobacillus kokaensis TaxID=2759023 RepID=A0ABQ3MXR4_9BACI|nr:LCP family protein [Neobacillus kokaensis]GHH97463.1 LytR family transcriptional regulator [Neobacillus kokaensis]
MSINRQSYIQNQKKKKRRLKRWVWFVAPILILLLGAGAYAGTLYKKAESVMNKSYKPIERDSARAKPLTIDKTSILLIGVDDSDKRKNNGPARSDALMLATFNKTDKSVKLLSIPRDSYVHIPEKDIYTKINHAHAYGGVKLTLETVEELLDVPVDYYVKMNFNAFIDIVNALDGITVDVPYTFSEQDSKDRAKAITLEKGVQNLDGEQALAFARTRKMDSDIQRGERQQQIMKAIVTKAASVKSLGNYTDVMEAVGKNMTTDLTFDQMKSFLGYLQAGNNLNIETFSLAGQDSYINSVYYYQLDQTKLEETKKILQDHLHVTDDTNKAVN